MSENENEKIVLMLKDGFGNKNLVGLYDDLATAWSISNEVKHLCIDKNKKVPEIGAISVKINPTAKDIVNELIY